MGSGKRPRRQLNRLREPIREQRQRPESDESGWELRSRVVSLRVVSVTLTIRTEKHTATFLLFILKEG